MNSQNNLKNSSAVASTDALSFRELLKKVRADFPAVSFKSSDMFRWSAESSTIYYDSKAEFPVWSLLHELGHMKHGHNVYSTDAALIRMEIEAWEAAKVLALGYGLSIDSDHIEDCMDSYRNWQHKRSTCPVCSQTGVEKLNGNYRCLNCRKTWQVGSNRFDRVYRRSATTK